MENVFHKCPNHFVFFSLVIMICCISLLFGVITLSCVKQPVFLIIFSLIYKHQNVHFLIQMKKAQKIACCEVLLTGTAKEIWWQTQTITSTDLYWFLENDTQTNAYWKRHWRFFRTYNVNVTLVSYNTWCFASK